MCLHKSVALKLSNSTVLRRWFTVFKLQSQELAHLIL